MATIFSIILFHFISINFTNLSNSESILSTDVLQGLWKLDMTPTVSTDSNFTYMNIDSVDEISFKGYFYREGVEIREARINLQPGRIYGALISGDNSGQYNSTFYYEDGILYGTTHSLDRDFLAVWKAFKE